MYFASEVKQIKLYDMLGNGFPLNGNWLNDHVVQIDVPNHCGGMFTVQIKTKDKNISIPLLILSSRE